MHIVIAVITALAGLIWALVALQNAGLNLNHLNPFYWVRRRKWEKKQIVPLFALDSPRELAAVLMFAAMRQGGDPTTEQKDELLGLYQTELKYDDKQSTEMYAVASHLLDTDPNYMHKVREIIAPSLEAMTEEQRSSTSELVRRCAGSESELNNIQVEFLRQIDQVLGVGNWQ